MKSILAYPYKPLSASNTHISYEIASSDRQENGKYIICDAMTSTERPRCVGGYCVASIVSDTKSE